jgi:nicotinamidase-related amidase
MKLLVSDTQPKKVLMLYTRGIRNLVFVGIATNVCVESTLRDGFFLEYFGVAIKGFNETIGVRYPAKKSFNVI